MLDNRRRWFTARSHGHTSRSWSNIMIRRTRVLNAGGGPMGDRCRPCRTMLRLATLGIAVAGAWAAAEVTSQTVAQADDGLLTPVIEVVNDVVPPVDTPAPVAQVAKTVTQAVNKATRPVTPRPATPQPDKVTSSSGAPTPAPKTKPTPRPRPATKAAAKPPTPTVSTTTALAPRSQPSAPVCVESDTPVPDRAAPSLGSCPVDPPRPDTSTCDSNAWTLGPPGDTGDLVGVGALGVSHGSPGDDVIPPGRWPRPVPGPA